MKTRSALALAALVASLATSVVATAPANAAVINGSGTSLTFSGSGGDYISQDQAWSYDLSNAVFSAEAAADGSAISLNVHGATWWDLHLNAPQGQQLTAGTTYDATRWPFQSPLTAGFDLSGDGRGCNQSTSTVTVKTAKFGPNGWIEAFDATFAQHCENGDSYAAGEVIINNGPAPKPLSVTVSPAASEVVSKSSGAVTVTGTVTCNENTTVNLNGRIDQRVNRTTLASGTWSTSVSCSTTPTKFTAVAFPATGVPFGVGAAQVQGNWTALDSVYNNYTSDAFSQNVKLVKG